MPRSREWDSQIKLMALMCKNEDGLRNTLTDKQKEMLDKFDESTSELNGFLEYKAVKYGFILAVKIMMECFCESKSTLNDPI